MPSEATITYIVTFGLSGVLGTRKLGHTSSVHLWVVFLCWVFVLVNAEWRALEGSREWMGALRKFTQVNLLSDTSQGRNHTLGCITEVIQSSLT